MWEKLYYWLFPFLHMVRANKSISEKMIELVQNLADDETYMSEDMRSFIGIPIIEVEKIHESVLANRKSLEEKAKVNVLIVTIAVTVILGLTSFLFTIQEKIQNGIIFIAILSILFVFCLLYLITGSLVSLATLNAGETKMIYRISPQEYQYIESVPRLRKDIEIRYHYSRNTELNNYVNLKISNYVSCTFANIRNAIILLGVIGIIMCFLFIFGYIEQNKVNSLEEKLSSYEKKLNEIEKNLGGINIEIIENDYNETILFNQQEELRKEINRIDMELQGLHDNK